MRNFDDFLCILELVMEKKHLCCHFLGHVRQVLATIRILFGGKSIFANTSQ